jgi:hypothetical protein
MNGVLNFLVKGGSLGSCCGRWTPIQSKGKLELSLILK